MMIKIKYLFFSILLLSTFFCAEGFAQRSSGGAPISLQSSDDLFTKVKKSATISLLEIDNLAEQERANEVTQANCSDCENPYYGTGIDVGIDIKSDNNLEILEDGSKLWLLKIESLTAYGLQFYFDKFKLPFGAKLFIFNEDKTMILGAYTSNNNPKDETKLIKFGTQPIKGGNIYIEYHEPINSEFEGELSITKVIHIFNKSGPWALNGGAGPCNINVSCPEGTGWGNEINSVVLILGYNSTNNFAAHCSGALINNRNVPKRALLLSANHCIDDVNNTGNTSFDYSTWMFLFNHQTSGCNDDGSNVTAYNGQSKYGSTYLISDATGSPTSDHLLLDIEMTETELAEYGACYAGWDATDGLTQGSPFVGIHHPLGDVKKISIEDDAIKQTVYFGFSELVAGRNHFKVNWDKGTTHGGSSGSPLFNNQHRIVGQLHGGDADCNGAFNNGLPDWYGIFGVNYASQMAFFIAPGVFPLPGNSFMDTECAASLVGPGGANGVPLSDCQNNQFQQGGFYIDGKQGVVEVCVSNPITLSNGCAPLFYPQVRRVDGSRLGSECSNLQSAGGYFDYSQGLFNCTVYYAEIFISVTLVNSNTLAPAGPEYVKWQGFDQPQLSVTSSGSSFSVSMGAFDLRNYLPSPYITFYSGQTYRVKLAGSGYNGWSEYTNYIHFYTDNRTINSQNITSNVYGKYVTINNSTVSTPIEVVGEQSIIINPSSTLYAGLYRIDALQSCGSFRIAQTNDNVDQGNGGEVQAYHESNLNKITLFDQEMEKSINPRFNLYPNPNNGQFNIAINDVEGAALIEVYDVMGKKVFTQRNTNGKTTIDITHQPTGIYLIKITVGSEVFTEKVVYQ